MDSKTAKDVAAKAGKAQKAAAAPVEGTGGRMRMLRNILVFVVPLLAVLLYPQGSALLEQVNIRVKRAPLVPVSEFGNIVSYKGAPETEIILYYFGANATWEQIATSPFTLIYLCFGQIAADNINHMDWPEWCDNGNPLNPQKDCELGVSILKKYGKKVGISIGGGDGTHHVPRVFTIGYETWVAKGRQHKVIEDWVKAMLDFVRQHDMDALDFDNEEAHTSWTGGTADASTNVEALADRAGLDFMGELQVEMRKQSGIDFIFTVSLQPPFYCPVKPIEDPGKYNPLKFPVEPRAPWYQNYMYLFESHPLAYQALTYLIFMYYPFENMWEWVSSIDEISHPFKIAGTNGTTVANLTAIYRSQINYQMMAGTVGKLEAAKMIIATQTNEPVENKAWIPKDLLRAQLATLTAADRPAGIAVWSHPHSMSKESCDFLAVACEFSKQCATADQLICPPKTKLVQVNPGTNVSLTEVYDWGLGSGPAASSTKGAATATKTGLSQTTPSAGGGNTETTSAAEPSQAASKAVMAMLMFILGAILLL